MQDFYNLIGKASDAEIAEWLRSDARNMLYLELYIAELQARKGGKRKTFDTHCFEVNLIENLELLADALWDYEYKPSRGTAHVIFNPVQREIFAAPYVDRVVHHYIVNALLDWWERRLNFESCSCRVGRGTSFGIARLDHHVRSVSQNFTRPCYVVKMDISGYFMHIKRSILYDRVLWGLDHEFVDHSDSRYVDDFYIVVGEDKLAQARRDVRAISAFLESIGLRLNMKKTRVIPSWQGVPFLGMVVRDGAVMPDKRMARNYLYSAKALVTGMGKLESIVSYLGMLKHYNARKVSQKVFDIVGWEYRF